MSTVGALVNPIQEGLSQAHLEAPQFDQGKNALSALGIGGGLSSSGANNAPIVNPVTAEDIDRQRRATLQGQQNQASFLTALIGQNGIQNQSDVYNQLQNQANGTGPNPAQAMLANSTGANVANQAALMASQRGAGANPALLARQAAMQGSNIQQQAAGQGAALQAQQSMNALGQLGNLANQQVGQQANATNAFSQSALQGQQNVLGGQGAFNNALVGSQSSVNAANAGNNQSKNNMIGNVIGGLTGGLGAALQLGKGKKDDTDAPMGSSDPTGNLAGGDTAEIGDVLAAGGGMITSDGPQSNAGRYFMDQQDALGAPSMTPASAPARSSDGGADMMKGLISLGAKVAPMLANGGKVPAMVSPGEKYLSPDKVSKVANGANPMSIGEEVPGKAKVSGAKNSYANDTVPATLEEGGIVIPRSITQGKDAGAKAKKFVEAILAKQGLKKKG